MDDDDGEYLAVEAKEDLLGRRGGEGKRAYGTDVIEDWGMTECQRFPYGRVGGYLGGRGFTEFNRVDCPGMDIGGVGLTGEFGRKSHCGVLFQNKMESLNGIVFGREPE